MNAVVHLHIEIPLDGDARRQLADVLADIANSLGAAPAVAAVSEVSEAPASSPVEEGVQPDPLACATCGRTFGDKRGARACERSHETATCDRCGRTLSKSGYGPHRKHCQGTPPGPPTFERRPFDPDEARRRAAAAAIGEE